MQMLEEIKHKIHKYKRWEPLVFFTCGFAFDAVLLHRIDDPLMLTHQAIYLTLSAVIIAWDLLHSETAGPGETEKSHRKWLKKIWSFREGVLHFLLGTLLNVYTIFYFKSGTLIGSLVFLLILMMLLFLNEVRPANISKTILRNSLFGLCLVSYMNIVVSILVGSIGVWVFLLAIAAAAGVLSLFTYFLQKKLDKEKVSREIRLPFLGVTLLYLALYLFKILPPVPLSVKFIGIYHSVTKSQGPEEQQYQLGYERASWRFWQSGDQTFYAKPGDKIFCFVQVFSPTNFKDELFVHWQFHDPKHGWTKADAIPLGVTGGRAEGFRGFTTKTNYQPGDWRVSIQTSDGREIGRIGFEVVAAEGETGEMKYEYR